MEHFLQASDYVGISLVAAVAFGTASNILAKEAEGFSKMYSVFLLVP